MPALFGKPAPRAPQVSERYGLLIEEYLRCCGEHRTDLHKQWQVES